MIATVYTISHQKEKSPAEYLLCWQLSTHCLVIDQARLAASANR